MKIMTISSLLMKQNCFRNYCNMSNILEREKSRFLTLSLKFVANLFTENFQNFIKNCFGNFSKKDPANCFLLCFDFNWPLFFLKPLYLDWIHIKVMTIVEFHCDSVEIHYIFVSQWISSEIFWYHVSPYRSSLSNSLTRYQKPFELILM